VLLDSDAKQTKNDEPIREAAKGYCRHQLIVGAVDFEEK